MNWLGRDGAGPRSLATSAAGDSALHEGERVAAVAR